MAIIQTYIAEGFMEDCEILVHTLTDKYQKVNWHQFCQHWKEMQFDIIFYGRQSGPEVVEFTEECLQTARLYMVTKTDNFEDQVVGLFIAYAIILIQPYKNLCALRLIPDDVAPLKTIEDTARKENRRDILMILGRMYFFGHTQFHASVRERAMDISIRKYFDGTINMPHCICRRWNGLLDRHYVKDMEKIAQTETNYTDLKNKAKMMTKTGLPGVKIVTDTFNPGAKQYADSLRKMTSGENGDNKPEVENYDANNVKRKAMKKKVDPMRHLHGLAERQQAREKYEQDLENQKLPPKRIYYPKKKPTSPKVKPGKNYVHLTPKNNGKPMPGFSLPDLGAVLNIDNPEDSPIDQDFKSDGTPEEPFKGFTADDVSKIDSKEGAKNALDLKSENLKDIKTYKSKGTKIKVESNSVAKRNKKEDDSKPATKTKSPAKHKAPSGRKKRKNNNNNQGPQKKRKVKHKSKVVLSGIYSDSNTSSDNSYTSNEETVTANKLNTDELKSTELTIQTKGVVKHFIQFEVSDIVVRTEKDAPPIEIEYIDNYKGSNVYEEVCEVSDDEGNVGNDIARKEIHLVECNDNENENNENDTMEMFQMITKDESGVATVNASSIDLEINDNARDVLINVDKSGNESDDEDISDSAVKMLMNKRKPGRRCLKQPSLRSKLKKMGLLPVASLVDDSNNE